MVRWPLIARRFHKWLALFMGIQVVLWTLTGFYMVVIHIDRIHGDHLVRSHESAPFDLAGSVSPASVATAVEGATEVRSASLLGRPVWYVTGANETRIFDLKTGAAIAGVDDQAARQIARSLYTGEGEIASARLLTTAPVEMQGRKPPYWQVTFDRWDSPTFYISPTTGELISRRHSLWRIFDFAWMLHIMDYDDRSNVNNPLLRVSTWMAVAMALTGAWLLIWAFPRKRRRKSA